MKKELIKAFFLYGLSSAASKFIAVLLLPIYTQVFSVEEYGQIDVIQSVIYIIIIFGILQLETSLQRFYYELDDRNRNIMISSILWGVGILSCLFTGISLFCTDILSELLFETDVFSDTIKIALLLIPLTNLTTILFVVVRYMKKPLLFTGFTIIQVVTSALATLILILHYHIGINAVFIGQIIGFGIVLVCQLVCLRKMYSFTIDVFILKKALSFALPQFPARIGSTCNAYINRFFMLSYLSAAAIGLFSVALKFASVILLVQNAFLMVWVPFMYESLKRPDHKRIYAQVFNYVCIGVFLFVCLIALFADNILQLFTRNPDYYDAALLIGGLALYQGMFIIKEVVDIGPKITKQTIYITYTYLISAVFNIISLYLALHIGGLKAVVVSMIFTNVVLIIFSWLFTNKLYSIEFGVKKFTFLFLLTVGVLIVLQFFSLSLVTKISITLLTLGFLCFVKKKRLFVLANY